MWKAHRQFGRRSKLEEEGVRSGHGGSGRCKRIRTLFCKGGCQSAGDLDHCVEVGLIAENLDADEVVVDDGAENSGVNTQPRAPGIDCWSKGQEVGVILLQMICGREGQPIRTCIAVLAVIDDDWSGVGDFERPAGVARFRCSKWSSEEPCNKQSR